jgi:hypothetical protein
MAKTRKLRKPNKKQRLRLANTLKLRKYCKALGVEWDPKIVPEDSWDVDERRYEDLYIDVTKVLCAKLKVRLPMYIPASYHQPDVAHRLPLTYDVAIDIARRAGWIEPA